MNRSRTSRRQQRKTESKRNAKAVDAGAITRMVASGEANPFPMGSREHIAFAFADELKREAASDSETPLAKQARRIFPASPATTRRAARADADAATTPPIPARKPEQAATDIEPPIPQTKPTPQKLQINEIWSADELFPVSREFADTIDIFEKSFDRWHLVNPSSRAAGRYQLLPRSLFDIGLMTADEQWHGHPFPDGDEFLQDPELQNLAFAAYLTKMWGYVEGDGLTRYVGQEIEAGDVTFEVTEAGLLAAAHREGQGRVKQYFEHLEADEWVSDPETFPIDDIPGDRTKKEAFEQVEERLIGFENIPLYASDDVPALNETEPSE